MYLTKEEEQIYNGEYGWAKQVCMKILVKLGEIFDATKLITIDAAHVSGVSYKNLGDAPIDFLETLSSENVETKVRATLNPQSFDPEYLREHLPQELFEKQQKVLRIFRQMGFEQSYTCTPYYIRRTEKNSHLAWAESSAVVYANSVLRAWTNREGGPSALAAAIIGKTPDYGMHKPENRNPNILVQIKTPLKGEVEYGALGILLGRILKDKIPIIKDLRNASQEHLKQLSAALASTGMTNMFHYTNNKLRPEKIEKINIETREIKKTIEELTTFSDQKPDLVFIGCPHCSFNEIKQIAGYISQRKVRKNTKLWICTSRFIKEKAAEHVQKIQESGAKVLTDTCAVVTWTEKLGIKTIMTNSAKTAHYAPTLNNAETIVAPLKECLKTALTE